MSKLIKIDNYEEITRKAREHVYHAFKKPFFDWAKKSKRKPVDPEKQTPPFPKEIR